MATNLILPSLGFDMTEGKVAAWLRREGERVEKGEAVLEVETEKATVEVESPVSGTLSRIVVAAGSTVPVGTVVGVVAEGGEGVAPSAPSAGVPPIAPAPSEPPAAAPATAATGASAPPAPPAAPAPPAGAVPPEPKAPLPSTGTPPAGEGRIKASPLARYLAREAAIDLADLRGTGPDGRITEKDVRDAVEARRGAVPPPGAEAPPVAPPPSPAAEPPAGTAHGAGDSTSVPLSRMRRAIARRMAESKAAVPHFYVTVEADMTEAMEVRRRSMGGRGETGISLNDLVVAAAARTLVRHPYLNASFRGDRIELHGRVCVGIAVALDEGLVVPVLHDADRKSLGEIACESRGLVSRARGGKLRPEDLGPGTFSVSNLSTYGVDEFTAIVNPPEAAILAVGAVVRRPVAAGDEVRIAPTARFTLSVDHRVADGATASRFLADFRRTLEKAETLTSP